MTQAIGLGITGAARERLRQAIAEAINAGETPDMVLRVAADVFREMGFDVTAYLARKASGAIPRGLPVELFEGRDDMALFLATQDPARLKAKAK